MCQAFRISIGTCPATELGLGKKSEESRPQDLERICCRLRRSQVDKTISFVLNCGEDCVMHTLGKVLAFLVVVAAIFASVFTSKLVKVRNSWTAKSVTSKNKLTDLKPKIEALEAQIDALKNEIFRSRELWGSFYPVVQTAIANPLDGTVQVNIGSQNGVRDKLLLHGFEIAADGSSIYRGSFIPIAVDNAGATLKPNWRATPDEVRTWQPGNWRWRNLLPPGYSENFDKQLMVVLKLEETLNDRLRTLEGQKVLLTQANDKLKLRESELIGGEGLSKDVGVDPEFRDGLVSAMSRAEEDRNQTLRKIDELRRTVRSVQADIERIQSENAELTGQLPQPGSRNELTQKK